MDTHTHKHVKTGKHTHIHTFKSHGSTLQYHCSGHCSLSQIKKKKKLNRHFIIETLCVANTIVGKVLELSFTVTAKTKCDFSSKLAFHVELT